MTQVGDDLRAVGAKLGLKGERRPGWLPAGRTFHRVGVVTAG